MYNVLVIDSRRTLADDIKLQLLVEGIGDDELSVAVISPENADEMIRFIGPKRYDLALVEHESMSKAGLKKTDFGNIKVFGYCAAKNEPVMFDAEKVPFMGYASKSDELIKMITDCINERIPIVPSSRPQKDVPVDNNDEKKDKGTENANLNEETQEPDASREKKMSLQSILDGEDDDSEYVPPAKVEKEQPTQKKEESKELLGERIRKDQVNKVLAQYEKEDENLLSPSKGTTVISCFSGKGGVGKSTVAANIALYLSMIPHGRGTYRVCLVDYNVESGDIRSLLGINSQNTHAMNEWSEEIHAQLSRGRNAKDIEYSATQMAPFLTPYKTKSTLSVLLAPELHEDAQFIEGEHLQIMLRNIIKNGGFDFVICDTADNTYDGTYTALSMSDLVLLICTQDVTTANRNDSVMRTLQRSNIDLTKFRLIINDVSSKRRTGIGVDEIKKFFKDYECIGVIHEEQEVTYANNNSAPLVYKPNHQFTKDLQGIIQYLINDNNARIQPEKKSFLARLFNK